MELHVRDTTLSFPLEVECARSLALAVKGLLDTFAEKQGAAEIKRHDVMHFERKGEAEDIVQNLEVTCNPNAYPTVVEAKLLISLATRDGVSVSTEQPLNDFKSDLKTFLIATTPRG